LCDRCFTKPRNYLQISTEIFILTGGTPFQAISDARGFRLGFSCFHGAPLGVNYLQNGRIYFEGGAGE
jgi:hypothetical protein